MDDISKNRPKKHICAALLAHVDAGKTTLSESMLYVGGSIRKMGRVDHGDAFLDTYELERARGITIFSKQAILLWKDMDITLLDTPGHVDFSAEMERTLQVLDYAIVVISGADGVQGHTFTLWRLLKEYNIPVFLFINKMDQEGTSREGLLTELKKRLDASCIDFGAEKSILSANPDQSESALGQKTAVWLDELAMCDDKLLEEYLETGSLTRRSVKKAIRERKIFPCYFGSALKVEGIREFLDGLWGYTDKKQYPSSFGARVYKIARDAQEVRLTYIKVTGGVLKIKDTLPDTQEKINQIRIYSGAKYESVQVVQAGQICAVTGAMSTYPGQGIGWEQDMNMCVLEPVITRQIQLPKDCDIHRMLSNLKELEEEEPKLHIVWEEQLGEIHVQLMGEVQTEVLKSIIWERFQVAVEFGPGNIVYKETIQEPVEGVGHFEPLRHYAEVHLLLEPGERGSGLVFGADLSEDLLDGSWQRLILTHLEEKEHIGVLTGSGITDIKITLIAGRAHTKHTEGGDFRQATYRAVRQGLKKAKSVLLEPYYEFQIELPSENVGRAMADMRIRGGEFEAPQLEGGISILEGTVPVASMTGYQTELLSYTGGQGRLFCTPKGYERCHNQEEVVKHRGYDSETDIDNPTGSVFCAHGSGNLVKWNQVEDHMHVESPLRIKTEEKMCSRTSVEEKTYSKIELTEEELDGLYRQSVIFNEPKHKSTPVKVKASEGEKDSAGLKELEKKGKKSKEEYLLVDGYNIIFAWEELKQLAETNIESARNKLMDILCNYQGYKQCKLILVFDAYNVENNEGEVLKYNNIHVVYTKEAETADQYIEKTVHQIGGGANVMVATSDALEQLIIMGQGARRMSAKGLLEDMEHMLKEIREEYLGSEKGGQQYLFDYMTKDMAEYFEAVRLGRETYYGDDGTTK